MSEFMEKTLIRVAAALFVIFPLRWRQVSQSAADIERVHRASVGFKYASRKFLNFREVVPKLCQTMY